MAELGDNYFSGLGADGVLTVAAGYDGFVFEALAGMSKAVTLAQSESAEQSASVNLATLTPDADQVSLPGAAVEQLNLADMAEGLFATNDSASPGADAHVSTEVLSFDAPLSFDPSSADFANHLDELRAQIHHAVQGFFQHNELFFFGG